MVVKDTLIVLNYIKAELTEDSNILGTKYHSMKEFMNNIESVELKILQEDISELKDLGLLFAPVSCLQEHSISNNGSE